MVPVKLPPESPPADVEAPVEPTVRANLVPSPHKLCITKGD